MDGGSDLHAVLGSHYHDVLLFRKGRAAIVATEPSVSKFECSTMDPEKDWLEVFLGGGKDRSKYLNVEV